MVAYATKVGWSKGTKNFWNKQEKVGEIQQSAQRTVHSFLKEPYKGRKE
jgi:hypothetical protein